MVLGRWRTFLQWNTLFLIFLLCNEVISGPEDRWYNIGPSGPGNVNKIEIIGTLAPNTAPAPTAQPTTSVTQTPTQRPTSVTAGARTTTSVTTGTSVTQSTTEKPTSVTTETTQESVTSVTQTRQRPTSVTTGARTTTGVTTGTSVTQSTTEKPTSVTTGTTREPVTSVTQTTQRPTSVTTRATTVTPGTNASKASTTSKSSDATTATSKPTIASTSRKQVLVDFEPVGCYRDSSDNPRPLPKLIGNFRKESSDADSTNLNLTIQACAGKARELGMGVFGVQSFGECYSGEHAQLTYSREGRSDNCTSGVGKAGANFVYRFTGKNQTTDTSKSSRCFPGSGQVELESGQQVRMRDLQVGDRVKTVGSGGDVIYSDVIAFLHKDDINEEFYALEIDDGTRVVLSSKHLIYSSKTNDSEMMTKFAETLSPGEYLYAFEKGELVGKRVARVYTVKESGIYAPLTRNGNLLVSGFLASCYAHWESHPVAHGAMLPLRAWYDLREMLSRFVPARLFGSNTWNAFMEKSPKNGIHWYAEALMVFSRLFPGNFYSAI